MKRSVFPLTLVFLFSLLVYSQTDGKKKKKKCKPAAVSLTAKVFGQATFTSSHCGGARLPDAALKRLMTPRPLAGKKLYIKKGLLNGFDNNVIVAEVVSDDSGRFTIDLPPGDYLVVDENKKDRKWIDQISEEYKKESGNYSAIDTVCLNSWYKSPDATFTVKKGSKNRFSVNYAKRCSWNTIPCVQYRGPLPP